MLSMAYPIITKHKKRALAMLAHAAAIE